MPKRIAYLGPAGTFTEQAALMYDPSARLVSFPSVPAVAAAVTTAMVDEGVAAIENSIDGSVNDTLDILIHESRLVIRQELVLPVDQYLLAKPGSKQEDIKVIYSHPQALGQCRRFLEKCFPKAQLVAALSTTAAVEEMNKSQIPAAAIATLRAAELYGAEVLARKVQDNPSNVTRFVVLAHEDHAPTGKDKTSLCLSFSEDRPGQLYAVIGEFASRDINLAKIESRPTKEMLGEYIFLIDLEGHRQDPKVKEALDNVRRKAEMFKILGSYPKYETPVKPTLKSLT